MTRYAPYLWLVYLAALVFQPAFDPDTTAADWVAVIVMVAVFLPLYRASLDARDPRRLVPLLAALAGLGLLGSLVNAGAGVFVVYAAALAGRLEPIWRAWQAIAGLVAVTGVMFVVSPVPMPWRLLAVVPVLVFTLVIGAAGIVEAERDRTQALLRRADEEIERLATIAERERIARDLHDLLGHTLSLVVLKSEWPPASCPSTPTAPSRRCATWSRPPGPRWPRYGPPLPGTAPGLAAELVNARRAPSAAGVDLEAIVHLPVLPAEQEAPSAARLAHDRGWL